METQTDTDQQMEFFHVKVLFFLKTHLSPMKSLFYE
jgi:hypothetical protein